MLRRFFNAALAATALASFAAPASAQDKWPSKPVTIVVPFAAGGNTDVMARIFADQLSRRLGQQFIIENKAGAGGVTGLAAMAKSPADGYTIAVGTSGGLAINPVLIPDKMPYNVEKDLTYLYGMAAQPNLFVVSNSVPVKTMAEFIAWLKANPGMPYATSGIGTSQHICGEMLALQIGIPMTPVAYRASNQSLQDLISGKITVACDNFAVAIEQVRGGNIRAISVTSEGEYPLAKDIEPTNKTLKDFVMMPAFGWVGPAGIPADVVKKITDELTAVGKLPEVRSALEKFGVVQLETNGPAYAEALRKERAGYKTVIDKAGIKVN